VTAIILAIAPVLAAGRSMAGVRIFLGICFVVVVSGAVYFITNRNKIFGGRGGDPGVDSPAAGNLRMWMVILVLFHAAVILLVTIFEL
jgi:hypothetical protein